MYMYMYQYMMTISTVGEGECIHNGLPYWLHISQGRGWLGLKSSLNIVKYGSWVASPNIMRSAKEEEEEEEEEGEI